MRMVRALAPWLLCVAAALAGCGKTDWNWDWWKKSKEPAKGSAQSGAKDANLQIGPEEALRLKDENKTLRDQIQELQIRDQQLADQLKQTTFLYEQQIKQIDILKEAPGERDKALVQIKLLTAEIELLREEITKLKGGGAPSASQPAIIPPAIAPPTPTTPAPTPPAPTPSVLTPPAQIPSAQTAPAPPPPALIPPVQLLPDHVLPVTPAASSAPSSS